MTPTLKNAAFALYSNSPGQPTGYGTQGWELVIRLKRDGADVAALSNYGLQGKNSSIKTPHGEVYHYAASFDPYGNDIHPANLRHWEAMNPDRETILITLYDVWVLKIDAWANAKKVLSWVPLDHLTIPDKVLDWLKQDNVRPIAMAPFGVRQMEQHGIECDYVPHSIDTTIFKPIDQINGKTPREMLGVDEDTFLVGMVAANKADSALHRKAFYENLLAFSMFKQEQPNAKIYIHTDAHGAAGGWNLPEIFKKVGITADDVLMPNQVLYRWGHPTEEMAAIYTACDVILGTSYGEGFGISVIESAACGTPYIGSNFAATPDLVAPEYRMPAEQGGLLVDGQPLWHPGLGAEFAVPSVPGIIQALRNAYALPRGTNEAVLEWSKNFDSEFVWVNHWLPVLERALA